MGGITNIGIHKSKLQQELVQLLLSGYLVTHPRVRYLRRLVVGRYVEERLRVESLRQADLGVVCPKRTISTLPLKIPSHKLAPFVSIPQKSDCVKDTIHGYSSVSYLDHSNYTKRIVISNPISYTSDIDNLILDL